MKGWQIFMHSVRQVFGNFSGALRVSAVLFIAMQLIGYFLIGGVHSVAGPGQDAVIQEMIDSGTFPYGRMMANALLGTVIGLWIAVGWHRYVLMNEVPQQVPTLRADRIWAYFLRGLWIGIIMIPVFVVMGLVIGLIGMALQVRADNLSMIWVLFLILLLPILAIILRLSAALPAAALGAPESVGDAWRATDGSWGDFLVLALPMLALIALLEFASFYLAGNRVVSTIWQIGIGWVSMMVSVSVLTTLYGHYIEKRALV